MEIALMQEPSHIMTSLSALYMNIQQKFVLYMSYYLSPALSESSHADDTTFGVRMK